MGLQQIPQKLVLSKNDGTTKNLAMLLFYAY